MTRSEESFLENIEFWAERQPKEAIALQSHELSEAPPTQDTPKEAAEWFQGLNLGQAEVLYIFGVGQGHYYEAARVWLEQGLNHHIVFLENNLSVIHRLFGTERGSAIVRDPQVTLIYFDDIRDQEGDLEVVYWNFIMRPMKVSALKEYTRTQKKLLDELDHKIHYDAAIRNAMVDEYMQFGFVFFKNFYPNMRLFSESFLGNDLFGKFEKVPAILCGAGPSLEKQLLLLKDLTDKALIFAGGSAMNVVTAAGIKPHFGAGIDPNPEQYKRLSEGNIEGIPYFYRARMYHDAFKQIDGPKLYVTGAGGYDVAEWFDERFGLSTEFFDEGHNVINFCAHIAHKMGCDPIIFLGMDLAFTGMKAYSGGVVEDATISEEEILDTGDLDTTAIVRKDIYGQPTYTLWKWVAESEWVSDFVEENPTINLINATEGGIGFPGVPDMELKEVVERYLQESMPLYDKVSEEIVKTEMPQLTEEKVVEAMETLAASLERTIDQLDTLEAEEQKTKEQIIATRNVPDALQSGIAALAETDLNEEIGFKYVLDIFNAVFTRVVNRDIQEIRINSQGLPEHEIAQKKLDLAIKKTRFLRQVARANKELIELSLSGEL